jgi:CheY-like chemotaxis protein
LIFLTCSMIVLYVDDDSEDLEIFCEAVQTLDPTIECVVARKGEEALGILHSGLVPDFIFLDINMPILDGKTILSEVRKDERLATTLVVMHSMNMDAKEIEEFKKSGANQFLAKPDHFQDLCDSLSSILKTPHLLPNQ